MASEKNQLNEKATLLQKEQSSHAGMLKLMTSGHNPFAEGKPLYHRKIQYSSSIAKPLDVSTGHNFFEALAFRAGSVAVVAPFAVFGVYPLQALTIHHMTNGANGAKPLSFEEFSIAEYNKQLAKNNVKLDSPKHRLMSRFMSPTTLAVTNQLYQGAGTATRNSVASKLTFLLPWKMGQYLGEKYNYPVLAPLLGFVISTEAQIQVNFTATMRAYHRLHDRNSKEANMPKSEFNSKKYLPQKRAWRLYNGWANFVTIGTFELSMYALPTLFPNLQEWHGAMAGASVLPANLLLVHAFKATTKSMLRQPINLSFGFFFGRSVLAAGFFRTFWRGSENGMVTGGSKRVENEATEAYNKISASPSFGKS